MRRRKILIGLSAMSLLLGLTGCSKVMGEPKDAAIETADEEETTEIIKEDATENDQSEMKGSDNEYKLEDAIEGQVFETEFDIYGKVTFAPYWEEDNALLITLQQGKHLYFSEKLDLRFAGADDIKELTTVSFEDVNGDQKNDMVIVVKNTSYWEHTKQTFYHYEAFLLTQDIDNETFVFDEELSRAVNWAAEPSSIEQIRETLAFLNDTEYEEVTVYTDEEVRAMSYDEKVDAFLEGKVKVTRKASLLEQYKDTEEYSEMTKASTLHDLMKSYSKEYMEGNPFSKIKPEVSTEYYTARNKKYLFLSVGTTLSNDGFYEEYLIGEFDGQLQIVYEDASWSRSGQTYYDGIVISGGGSAGATHHLGEIVGINDAGDIDEIEDWENQTIYDWESSYQYHYNAECKISDVLKEAGMDDEYCYGIFMTKSVLNDKIYWTIIDEAYEDDKANNQEKHDKLMKALEQSELLEGGSIVTEEELEHLARERFGELGYPWVF